MPQSSELHKWFGEISISIFHINEEKIILTYVSNPKHSYKDTWLINYPALVRINAMLFFEVAVEISFWTIFEVLSI